MRLSKSFIFVGALLAFGAGCEHGLSVDFGGGSNEWDSTDNEPFDTEVDTTVNPTDTDTNDKTVDTSGSSADCGGVVCSEDQHCDAATLTCQPNDCASLVCSATEECVTTANGARCEDISCDDDMDCELDRYCDAEGDICKDDVCVPGAQSCDDPSVMKCASNGSGFEVMTTCDAAPSGYTSVCVVLSETLAGCSCQEDWDCPGYQQCEAGTCLGSPEAPTCRLDPQDLEDVLPSIEIKWGGAADSDRIAKLLEVDGNVFATPVESPWSASGQVVATPLVANLDDDNGDGKIDDRDVPEIIFMTFCDVGDHVTSDGLIRAIHGGGVRPDGTSKKGEMMLSICGDYRYYKGVYYDSDDSVLGSEPTCSCSDPQYDATSTLAVGDVDYDGKPDIVAIGEGAVESTNVWSKGDGFVAILDNEGKLITRTPGVLEVPPVWDFGEFRNPGPTLANVILAADSADELAEIAVGRDLFTLKKDAGVLTFDLQFTGSGAFGDNGQGPVTCVADLFPSRPGMEIVAGSEVYGIPLTAGDTLDTAATNLVTLATGGQDGFCGIADLWGADTSVPPGPNNALDRKPEIVLISGGTLYIYDLTEETDTDGVTTYVMTELTGGGLDLPGRGGGAPNIDDFDGDGFPEVGTAGELGYIVFDLQTSTGAAGSCPEWPGMTDDQSSDPRTPPAQSCTTHDDCGDGSIFGCRYDSSLSQGECICLHNGWQRSTQDASSRVTGSSVFDFNGDGAAEVIYNDECYFRMYSGFDGETIFIEPSESRTRIEYPIVADVDNDGNAEIVFATSNESGFCGGQSNRELFNNGIEVWGDPGDYWVSARRVWNQHAYHVTNIGEDGSIPIVEPNSWLPLGPRFYNTYRSQPRSYGDAPDLVVEALQVSSPDAVCGQLSTNLNIAVQISNQGDLRIGAGVPVVFVGTFEGVDELLKNESDDTLVLTLPSSLLPGEKNIFQVPYQASYNGKDALPEVITAIVDPSSDVLIPGDFSRPNGAERECFEDNNSRPVDVVASGAQADLRLTLDNLTVQCPDPVAAGTVYNDGVVEANDVLVRIYAGDPGAGGTAIAETVITQVAASSTQPFSITLTDFPTTGAIALYAIVDPQNDIEECNDGNNKAGPSQSIDCSGGPVF